MELNSYNFIRWSEDDTLSPSALPQAYIRERDQYPYMPVLVPGETSSFYINLADGVDYAGTLSLRVIKDGVATAIAGLEVDDLGTGFYNPYAEFVTPVLANGIYQLQIINELSEVLLTSNYVRVMNSGYENITAYFEFRNDIDLYNTRYSVLTDFYQKIRLHITEVDSQFEQNREQYQSATSGKYRNLLATDQNFITFQSYFFDKEAHKAVACMIGHSEIYINTKQYTFKTGYKYDPILLNMKTKGTFEMWNPEFVTINKCG